MVPTPKLFDFLDSRLDVTRGAHKILKIILAITESAYTSFLNELYGCGQNVARQG
jgi:hypothetical protein